MRGSAAESEGLTGLKALGVRDLNYKLAFLACNISSHDSPVRTYCRYLKRKTLENLVLAFGFSVYNMTHNNLLCVNIHFM